MFHRTDYELSDGKLMSFAFPGGYPLHYLTKDGGNLCPECADGKECREASDSDPSDAQWLIIAAEVNWEDNTMHCDHCENRIFSAYAEDD